MINIKHHGLVCSWIFLSSPYDCLEIAFPPIKQDYYFGRDFSSYQKPVTITQQQQQYLVRWLPWIDLNKN